MAGISGGWIGRREFLKVTGGTAAALAAPRVARAQQPKRGGILKHIGLEPPSFDIHATVSYQTQLVSSFVHRTLFKFVNGPQYNPSDFTLVPDLALKVEVSRDGRQYTITLRQGVRWEPRPPVNGRELVAADVKYSLERAAKKSGYASLLGQLEAVETPDKYTVRVHLG
ncbi:MAG: ABC transporter substrate-binding protein, partial [Candidatus Rokuibacteriota bacterium]